MADALAGRTIWITRPAHQAGEWAAAVTAAGAQALVEPLLVIEPPAARGRPARELAAAEDADIVIATSANAVAGAWRLRPGFAPRGALYAVGRASAGALAKASARDVAQPRHVFDSEAVLALPALQAIAGRRVVLLSGEGGQTTLADTLGERGAEVVKIALYRRRPAAITGPRLAALLARADTVVVTSGQALTHLIDLAERERAADPGADLIARLTALRLVVPSARVVKQHANRLHWISPPIVPARMDARALVSELVRRHRP